MKQSYDKHGINEGCCHWEVVIIFNNLGDNPRSFVIIVDGRELKRSVVVRHYIKI